MHLHSYLNSAKKIISEYNGAIPFSAWLKFFFKQDKKYGSRDRKMIADLCYCYFRLRVAFDDIDVEEKFLIGQFLCHSDNNIFLHELKPEWNEKISSSLDEKLSLLQKNSLNIFPFNNELGKKIDRELFNKSFIIQPHVFLRIRPGKKEIVFKKLQRENISFQMKDDDCIAIANNTKIDDVLEIDKEVVVQDFNSQRIIDLFLLRIADCKLPIEVWDCCAGSGGKSILLKDVFPNAELTASDVRESILINLKNRFKRVGIKNYKSFIADLSNSRLTIDDSLFDLVLCDAPCSGSGTWSRTPEQLTFFKIEKIEHYQNLQKKISVNAARAVKEDGYFLYITCSVFKKENEDVVEFILSNSSLKLVEQKYFAGYEMKADTLFAALFQL